MFDIRLYISCRSPRAKAATRARPGLWIRSSLSISPDYCVNKRPSSVCLPHCPEGEIEGVRSNHPYIQIPPCGGIEAQDPTDHTPLAAPRRTTVSSSSSNSSGSVVRNKGGQKDRSSRNRIACQLQRRIAGSREGTNTLRKALCCPQAAYSVRLWDVGNPLIVKTNTWLQQGQNTQRTKNPTEQELFWNHRYPPGLDLWTRPKLHLRWLERRRPVAPVGWAGLCWACIASHQVACSISHSLQQ